MPRISPSFPPFLPASPRRGFLADLAEPDSQIAIKKLSSGSSASSVSTLSGGLPIKIAIVTAKSIENSQSYWRILSFFFVREHRLERVGEAVKVIPISVDGADNLPEK